MQTYTIDTPDGHSYDIEAENDQQAQSAINSYLPSEPSVVNNIVPDIKQMLSGIGGTIKEGAFDMPMRALSSGVQVAGGVPYAQTPSGQRDTELVKNAPEQATQMVRPVTHPIDYFQEHPVQQSLNALGAGMLAAKGAGAALNAVPFTENMVPTLQRIANNQTLKGFGGTMGQLKQMEESGGRQALDEAAQFARSKGLSDVFTTDIGRGQMFDKLLESSGKKVGSLREQAGTTTPDIVNKVLANPKANIDEYLGEGLASGELPQVDKAIADIQRIAGPNPTHAKLAEAATYINKQAAGNKLYQPVTAATDVANALSDENNQQIAQALGPDKAQQYLAALDEQKKLHPLEHLQARGELRQAGGRGGIGLQMVQKLADEFGYRLSAKTAATVHDALAGNLGVTPKVLAANLAARSANPINAIGQNPAARQILLKVLQKLTGNQQEQP